MAVILELRGLIYGQYKNESELAKKIGWPRQRLNKITTGSKVPDLNEVQELAAHLGISIEEMAQIFLKQKSPNGQQNAS